MLINEPSSAAWRRNAASAGRTAASDFGGDYAHTLKCWRRTTTTRSKAERCQGLLEKFHRLWRYYLMYCEGGFPRRRHRRRA
jgi:cyclopropane-fatty-acyl-phospholipid synthase